jgi:hypothetical protein
MDFIMTWVEKRHPPGVPTVIEWRFHRPNLGAWYSSLFTVYWHIFYPRQLAFAGHCFILEDFLGVSHGMSEVLSKKVIAS